MFKCSRCQKETQEDFKLVCSTGVVYSGHEGGWIRGWKLTDPVCIDCSDEIKKIINLFDFITEDFDYDV